MTEQKLFGNYREENERFDIRNINMQLSGREPEFSNMNELDRMHYL